MERRGSIAFFTTYRPLVALDIYSRAMPPQSTKHELHMTDGNSYNYNGQMVPPDALKLILKRPLVAAEVKEDDADSGMIFVSERTDSLETLHIAIRLKSDSFKLKIFNFAEVYDTFKGARMEDSGCIAGNYLIYVSTKDPATLPRQPWNAVYRTHLETAETERITSTANKVADLNPSVSPNGKKIAVASFQGMGWNGKSKNLKTDIYVMNVEKPFERKRIIKDGGWPSWGSTDNIIFFHRVEGTKFGVFRLDIRKNEIKRITPEGIEALTPAAIDDNTVAVATIREETALDVLKRETAQQYRHIEIFDCATNTSVSLTAQSRPKADHFNPFVVTYHGRKRIGYHRCDTDHLQHGGTIQRESHKLTSPDPEIGLFRVSGVFPTFSLDGSKLAFVDNELSNVWVADKSGLRIVHMAEGPDRVFAPVWNPTMDILYVCKGRSFHKDEGVSIEILQNVSTGATRNSTRLTRDDDDANNAFPSCNPQGTKFVFRSTRDHPVDRHKNLYIMEDSRKGEFGRNDGGVKARRLTFKNSTDTHCHWSPNGDWIVFSSDFEKPDNIVQASDEPDTGYFAVYLVKPEDGNTMIKVIGSGSSLRSLPGHVNHPVFSPDGKSIAFAADLAAVSVDPGSLPLFLHSVRPYGDIFLIDIDEIENANKRNKYPKFTRITHSRYENSTPSWTQFSTTNPNAQWNLSLAEFEGYMPNHPYYDGGDSWHTTGMLCIANKRKCC